jgi:hypothetical protein
MSRPDSTSEKGADTVPTSLENTLDKQLAPIPLLHAVAEENDATHRTCVSATGKGGKR